MGAKRLDLLVATLGAMVSLGIQSPARAASLNVEPLEGGAVLIELSGSIEAGDEIKFQEVALQHDRAIVRLNSNGGALRPGLEIGRAINLRGYTTLIADSDTCASSCALIWLAGETRFLGLGARVGFHASYRDENGRFVESSVGNALIGHYLSKLDLPAEAVIFTTQAPPDRILWLTPDRMDLAGIPFKLSDSKGAGETKKFARAEVAVPNSAYASPSQAENIDEIFSRANAGDPQAQTKLGQMYYDGTKIPQNYASSAHWLRKAADQGFAPAQSNLGALYQMGLGVVQDYSEALRLLHAAAAKGHVSAQYSLGNMYYHGYGMSADRVRAYMWYNISAASGYEKARTARDRLRLSRKDVEKAQQMTRECVSRQYTNC